MKIVSLIKSTILSKLDMTPPGREGLRVGDKLVGRVLEINSNNKAFIDFGRFRALAEVGFPVKKGEVINVKVLENGAPLRLSLEKIGAGTAREAKKTALPGEFPSKNLIKELRSQIKDALYSPGRINKGKPVPLEIQNAIIKLTSHFEPMDISKNISRLSSQLKTLTDGSGIFYEKKIEKLIETLSQDKKNIGAINREINQAPELKNIINKDLKPNLLILKDFLAGKNFMSKFSGSKNLEGIRSTVDKLLTEIVAQQKELPTQIKVKPPFELMDISKNISRLSSQLKAFKEESGMFYEKKIEKLIETLSQDKKDIGHREVNQIPEPKNIINKGLKPDLLMLKDLLDGKDFMSKFSNSKNLEGIRSTVDKLLTDIVAQQKELPTQIKVNPPFELMDISKNISRLSSQLKAFKEESGMFYEKKIEKLIETLSQDKKDIGHREVNQIPEPKNIINKGLKPDLLMLKDLLDGKDFMSKFSNSKNLEGIRSTVDKLLTDIIAQQSDMGSKPLRSESIQVYTYLLPLKEVEQDARIRIYYPKKNRSKAKNGFRVSLLLIMDRIGQIRTDLFLVEKNLDISFFVSEDNIMKCFDDHLEGLRESLNDRFNNLSVRVVVSEKKIDEFEFEGLIPLGSGLIDVKA